MYLLVDSIDWNLRLIEQTEGIYMYVCAGSYIKLRLHFWSAEHVGRQE